MPKALIVLSLQYDHLPAGALPYPATEEILTPIRNYLASTTPEDLVIAGREWHPENHFSFVEPWDEHDPLGPHCVQGTKGAKIHTGIAKYVDYTVSYGTHRGTEAYSAFAGKTLRPVQTVEEIFKERGIKDVEVFGTRLGVEVAQTAFDSNALGLNTSIVLNLTDFRSDGEIGKFHLHLADSLKNVGVEIVER